MEDIRKLAKDILEKGYLMSLGTLDENGVWVSNVIFVNDDNFNIYWFSEKTTRHSNAILKNKRASATITISNNPGEPNVGLQVEGVAEMIDGENLELAHKHWSKRKKAVMPKSGEVLDDNESWYVLRPSKIEVIYEPLFGFDKKILLLSHPKKAF